jgi:hypothetical protein
VKPAAHTHDLMPVGVEVDFAVEHAPPGFAAEAWRHTHARDGNTSASDAQDRNVSPPENL